MSNPLARAAVCGVSAALLASAGTAGASAAGAPSSPVSSPVPSSVPSPAGRTALTDTVPAWAARATPVAAADAVPGSSGTRQSVRVYLQPQGGTAAVSAAVTAVSTPGSPQYGHYLTEPQYVQRFAPTAGAAARVSSYLASQGLTVDGVEGHRRYVAASGTPAQLGAAFATPLRLVEFQGQRVLTPTTAASLPSAVASQVLTVTGLDTFEQVAKPQYVASGSGSTVASTAASTSDSTAAAPASRGSRTQVVPPDAHATARPCSVFYDLLKARYQGDATTPLPRYRGSVLSYAACGYTPPQLHSALADLPGLELGAGQTVGIVRAYNSSTVVADTNRLATNYGWPTLATGQLTTWKAPRFTKQTLCGAPSWTTEQTLDVQAVHAMRPKSAIRVYAGSDCVDGLGDALAAAVDENRADVVSNSWAGLEAFTGINQVHAYEQVFMQGALQGQTFLFSSGDNGDNVATTGYRQLNYPSSDPYVTSVGGTSTGLGLSQLGFTKVVAEAGWGTMAAPLSDDGKSWLPAAFRYGAGGGYSTIFPRPDWQTSVVPTSSPQGRATPDIASLADPSTGMLMGQTQTFPEGVHYGEFRVGGTSLASPLATAAILSAADSANARLGLVNPALYAADSGAFVDTVASPVKGVVTASYLNGVNPGLGTSYSVTTWGQDSTLTVATGWDDVTGRGRPGVDFAEKVAAVVAAAGSKGP